MAREKTLREKILALKWFNNPNEVIPILLELLGNSESGIKAIEAGLNVTITGEGTEEEPYVINSTGGGGGSGIQSIVAGTNITVDATDPNNPTISSTGAGDLQSVLNLGEEAVGKNIDLTAFDNGLGIEGGKIILRPVMGIPGVEVDYIGVYFYGNVTQYQITQGQWSIFDPNTGKGRTFYIGEDDSSVDENVQFRLPYDKPEGNYVIAVVEDTIPLRGTTENNPVTGPVQFSDGFIYALSPNEIGIAAFKDEINSDYNATLNLKVENGSAFYRMSAINSVDNSTEIIIQSPEVGGGAIEVLSNYSGFEGIVYKNDYSANFVDRSLPDVAFVRQLSGLHGNETVNPSVTNPIIIPHGLGVEPSYINVLLSDSTTIELREHEIAVDDTNITITFSNTPIAITSLRVWWEVKL